MRPFETANGEHDTAIFVSTSKRVSDDPAPSDQSATYATVATEIARAAEPLLLRRLFEYPELIGPFQKPEYLKPGSHDDVFEDVLDATVTHANRVVAAQRTYPPDATPDEAEIADIQAALLIADLLDGSSDPLVIVPGDDARGQRIVRTLDGLVSSIPAVDHCVMCRNYYPPGLATTLIARSLAHQIARDQCLSTDGNVEITRYKQTAADRWGSAATSRRDSTRSYDPKCVRTVHRERPRERVYCWYIGGVAHGGGNDEITVRFTELVQWCADRYPHLVRRLRGVPE